MKRYQIFHSTGRRQKRHGGEVVHGEARASCGTRLAGRGDLLDFVATLGQRRCHGRDPRYAHAVEDSKSGSGMTK